MYGCLCWGQAPATLVLPWFSWGSNAPASGLGPGGSSPEPEPEGVGNAMPAESSPADKASGVRVPSDWAVALALNQEGIKLLAVDAATYRLPALPLRPRACMAHRSQRNGEVLFSRLLAGGATHQKNPPVPSNAPGGGGVQASMIVPFVQVRVTVVVYLSPEPEAIVSS